MTGRDRVHQDLDQAAQLKAATLAAKKARAIELRKQGLAYQEIGVRLRMSTEWARRVTK